MVGLSSHSQNLYSVFEPQHVSAGVKPTRSQDWAALNFGGDIFNRGTGVSTYSSTSNWLPSNPDVSPSGLQSWNEMMLSTMDFGSPTYVMPSLPHCSSSPDSTPSPCPSPPRHYTSRNHSPLFNNLSITASCGAVDRPTKVKVCSHCRATSTPLWRREPHTLRPLCNACGLYLQQRNKHRPQELIDADIEDDSTDGSESNLSGPECSHCHTHQTSVWRRSKTGAQLCNACGVYLRLRGKDRPLSLKRNKIKPRSKHATK
ncbi:hypothetical protein BD779DRAFT_542538 [Infundibulicybe gibba]|nr:hypothetical protein BD779DRAFT_542538 [Infundibulicybe gibba]